MKLVSVTLVTPMKLFGRMTTLSSVSSQMDGVALEWDGKRGIVVLTMAGVDGEEWLLPAGIASMRWK